MDNTRQSTITWHGSFDPNRVPAYRPGLNDLMRPGGDVEQVVGQIENLAIQHRNGVAIHRSHYNPADTAPVISVLVKGSKTTKMAHVYEDGDVTLAPKWHLSKINDNGKIRLRAKRGPKPDDKNDKADKPWLGNWRKQN